MIESLSRAQGALERATQVVVIGSGPAGTVVALELARRGIDVIVIESGTDRPDEDIQTLVDAAVLDPALHAPLRLTQLRVLGGTSRIWGGRCLPFDPIDFLERPGRGMPGWPVAYEEIARHFDRACRWLDCGRAVFSARDVTTMADTFKPGIPDDEVTTSSLERWSLPIDFGRAYRSELENTAHLTVIAGMTCTEVECPPESQGAASVLCRNLGGAVLRVRAAAVVVAAGGLESTRILLSSKGPQGEVLGDGSGHLGHWYMAHMCGVASHIHLSDPPRHAFDFVKDSDGSYVRRRFSFSERYQLEHNLPNIVGWVDNPEAADASHHSGELSTVYLALSSRWGHLIAPDAMRLSITGTFIPGTPYGGSVVSPRASHLANLGRHPLRTAHFMATFGPRRLLASGRKAPGYMIHSPTNIYPFEFQGEHRPRPDSRVWLTDERDAVGMRRLGIDLRFDDDDINGVAMAHERWDRYLQKTGIGHLEYVDRDPLDSIRGRLGGGFHQTGTTRMATSATGGVVDPNLRVYGTSNVYVASGSTFVTSGHANPTLMIVAFASRLADHLASRAELTRV